MSAQMTRPRRARPRGPPPPAVAEARRPGVGIERDVHLAAARMCVTDAGTQVRLGEIQRAGVGLVAEPDVDGVGAVVNRGHERRPTAGRHTRCMLPRDCGTGIIASRWRDCLDLDQVTERRVQVRHAHGHDRRPQGRFVSPGPCSSRPGRLEPRFGTGLRNRGVDRCVSITRLSRAGSTGSRRPRSLRTSRGR